MLPDHPDANLDVVSTASHVLDAFQNMVKAELQKTGAEPVYDEDLTFETGIQAYLAKNNFERQERTDYPVFLYNRSQLRWPQGVAPSRRLNVLNGTQVVGDQVLSYKATQSEFDIQFMYLCRDVQSMERFEVVYQGETGISANRQIVVSMKDIGDFNYFLTYGDLVNKRINYEDSAYVAIMGQITVRGIYFTFSSANGALIKRINVNVWSKAGPPQGTSDQLIAHSTIISETPEGN